MTVKAPNLIFRTVTERELQYTVTEINTIVSAEESFYRSVGEQIHTTGEISYAIEESSPPVFYGSQVTFEQPFIPLPLVASYISDADQIIRGEIESEKTKELIEKLGDTPITFDDDNSEIDHEPTSPEEFIAPTALNPGDTVIYAEPPEIAGIEQQRVETSLYIVITDDNLPNQDSILSHNLNVAKKHGFAQAEISTYSGGGYNLASVNLNIGEIDGITFFNMYEDLKEKGELSLAATSNRKLGSNIL